MSIFCSFFAHDHFPLLMTAGAPYDPFYAHILCIFPRDSIVFYENHPILSWNPSCLGVLWHCARMFCRYTYIFSMAVKTCVEYVRNVTKMRSDARSCSQHAPVCDRTHGTCTLHVANAYICCLHTRHNRGRCKIFLCMFCASSYTRSSHVLGAFLCLYATHMR